MAKTQTADKKTAPVAASNVLNTEPQPANIATIPPAGPMAVKTELPDYLEDTREGSEHIERDDMLLPRLAIAQKMSYELDADHEKFIDGLKYGDFFNTITQRIYGVNPVEFVIVRADKPRWVEFNPREAGGGIKDMNVPANDPRTQFRRNPQTGASEPPIATKFYDFIVLLLPSTPGVPELEMIGVSFKITGLKTARLLNTLISQRGEKPLYAGKYELGIASAQNAKGSYKVYTVKNSSIASDFSAVDGKGNKLPGWVNRSLYEYAKKQFNILKDKTITIDATTEHAEDEGDASFDPSKFEGQQGNEPTDM